MKRYILIITIFSLGIFMFSLVISGCSFGSNFDLKNKNPADKLEEAKTKAQDSVCLANRKSIQTALMSYSVEYGELPRNLDQLVPDLLPKIPECPENGSYSFKSTQQDNRPVVRCSVHGITQ